jgi:hypothetical protein
MISSLIARYRALFASPTTLSDEAAWKPRRAPPVNADRALQSETHEWLRQIPRGLHPTQLCRHYPRLANRIALCWADPPQVARLLSDLMIDRRGHRRGFGPRINKEVDRLYRHNAERLTPLLRRRLITAPPHATEPKCRVDMGLQLAVRPIKK